MEAKDPPPVAVDPNLQAEQARAQQTLVAQLQTEAQGDTASLMARFGSRLALANGGMSAPTPAASPLQFT